MARGEDTALEAGFCFPGYTARWGFGGALRSLFLRKGAVKKVQTEKAKKHNQKIDLQWLFLTNGQK